MQKGREDSEPRASGALSAGWSSWCGPVRRGEGRMGRWEGEGKGSGF